MLYTQDLCYKIKLDFVSALKIVIFDIKLVKNSLIWNTANPERETAVKTGLLVPKTDAWYLCLSLVDNGHNEFEITMEKYYDFSWFEAIIVTSLYLPEKARNSVMCVMLSI